MVDENSAENFGQESEAIPILLHTLNGGESWQPTRVDIKDWLLHGINFVDAKHGWLIGAEYIYYTDNGGQSWSLSLKLSSN